MPRLPKTDANGNYPALDYIRASIARDIIQERRGSGCRSKRWQNWRESGRDSLAARIGQTFHRPCAPLKRSTGRSSAAPPSARPARRLDLALRPLQIKQALGIAGRAKVKIGRYSLSGRDDSMATADAPKTADVNAAKLRDDWLSRLNVLVECVQQWVVETVVDPDESRKECTIRRSATTRPLHCFFKSRPTEYCSIRSAELRRVSMASSIFI